MGIDEIVTGGCSSKSCGGAAVEVCASPKAMRDTMAGRREGM